jgi:hypothetical protein
MGTLSKDDMIRFAEQLWQAITLGGQQAIPEQTHELLDSAQRSFSALRAIAIRNNERRGGMSTPEEEEILRWAVYHNVFRETPDGQICLVAFSRWADCGYPQITMGHKFAAALLATNVSADIFPHIHRPWPAFVVEVPSGLLDISAPETNEQIPITRLLVTEITNRDKSRPQTSDGKYWAYFGMTDTSLSIWRFGVTTEELLPPDLEGNPLLNHSMELTEQDGRVASLIGRLIINMCLAMNDPDQVEKFGPGHKRYESSRREKKRDTTPHVRSFQLGKSIELDFRDHVRKFVREGSRSGQLSVQSLVAGHFKRVHHGPKYSKTKTLWISPYWKGPEDSPILLRAHKLPEE